MVFRYDHHSTTARPSDNDHCRRRRWVLPFCLVALTVIGEVVNFARHPLVTSGQQQRHLQTSRVQPFQDILEEKQEPKQNQPQWTNRSVVQEPQRAPQAVSMMQTHKTKTANTPNEPSNNDQYKYHQIDSHNNNSTHESFDKRQQEQTDEESLNGMKTDNNTSSWWSSDNNTSSWSMTPSSSSDSYFSACLLVMDENHRLPEWLAYHYYMLPLRHLVLLVDPRSETSPMDIVHRWRPYMKIDVWNHSDLTNFHPPADMTLKGRFRTAQPRFYKQCAMHLRQLNRTWVTFHDVDEYLYLDPQAVSHYPLWKNPSSSTQPGNILHFLQQGKRTINKTTNNTAMLRYKDKRFAASCFYIDRSYFGATEERADLVQQRVPSYLNGRHFETLRWLHRASHQDRMNNGFGKSIFDVSAPQKTLSFTGSVHRVLNSCRLGPFRSRLPFRIRHYLGSWQAYTSRVDARVGDVRSREIYLFRSQFGKDTEPDDDVRGWLQGFCNQFGNNQSLVQYLLQGVGQVPPTSDNVRNAQWSLSPNLINTSITKKKIGNLPPGCEIAMRFSPWTMGRSSLENEIRPETMNRIPMYLIRCRSMDSKKHATWGQRLSCS